MSIRERGLATSSLPDDVTDIVDVGDDTFVLYYIIYRKPNKHSNWTWIDQEATGLQKKKKKTPIHIEIKTL